MSHTAAAHMPLMQKKEVLKRAFERLGWFTQENATVRAYYTTSRKYTLVAVNPHGAYDIGVIENKDGTLTLEGDLSMLDDKARKDLGNNYEILNQNYTLEDQILECRDKGLHIIGQEALSNGVIRMEVEIESDAIV